MKSSYDVAVVSAFGRGHWLAAELADAGRSVALIDVSAKMGRWAPEDWEGPFGFFRTEKLKASQVERLIEDDYHDTVDEGFVVWLKDGPIDIKGPLSSFWLQKKGIQGEFSKYVSSYESLSSDDKINLKNKFAIRRLKAAGLPTCLTKSLLPGICLTQRGLVADGLCPCLVR